MEVVLITEFICGEMFAREEIGDCFYQLYHNSYSRELSKWSEVTRE